MNLKDEITLIAGMMMDLEAEFMIRQEVSEYKISDSDYFEVYIEAKTQFFNG